MKIYILTWYENIDSCRTDIRKEAYLSKVNQDNRTKELSKNSKIFYYLDDIEIGDSKDFKIIEV